MTTLQSVSRTRPQARVNANGRLVCDICGRVADAIHCDGRRWYAACPQHEPGYYWIRITDFRRRPIGWLAHLNEKTSIRPTWAAALLSYLGYVGARALMDEEWY